MPPRYAIDHFPAGARLGGRTPLCFAGRESYDIMLDGRKIGGNAQRRLKNAIFQHGSIPLRNCLATAGRFLREPPHGTAAETTALADLVTLPPLDEMKQLLIEALGETLATAISPDGLTAAESALAGR